MKTTLLNSYRVITPECGALVEVLMLDLRNCLVFCFKWIHSKNNGKKKNKFQKQTDKQINWVSRATHIFYLRICVTFIFVLSYRNRVIFTVLSTRLRKNIYFHNAWNVAHWLLLCIEFQ